MRAGSQLGLVALGERAGRPVRTVGARDEPPERTRPRHCAVKDGFNVHAGKAVAMHERASLEKLCRYGLRGPFANSRLTELPDGNLTYELKRALPSGATHLVLSPTELIEKLAALVPPAREHFTVYHGVFAAHHHLREKIVRRPRSTLADRLRRRRARGKWAELLKRVFAFELLVCPKCQGPRRVLEALHEPAAIARILAAHGESTTPPPRAPARDPPQPSLPFDAPAPDDFDQTDRAA